MSASNSVITPSNIQLSPMRVTFNGVDLGGTVEGVSVNPKYKLADIKVDQFGDTIVDAVVAGQGYNIKFVLAETLDVTKWKVAFPHSKLVGTFPNQSIYFDMQTGDKVSLHAAQLILHPLDKTDGDTTADFLFYKAVAMSASEVKYGPDKQTGLQVEMLCLPDTSVLPAKFMTYGNPNIGLVNASFAAAASGGGNVGNALISSISVSNQFTKTETITVSVVGQTSGNNIYVSGSQSGPLGEFHVAAANGSLFNFVSNPIDFTITQGTVQLQVGDVFTIATTGANYA